MYAVIVENDASPPAPHLHVLTSREEIESANDFLAERLKAGAERVGKVTLGYRGGRREATIYWHPDVDIWFCFEREENRSWNAFGMGNPAETGSKSIIVEINSPYEGINRKVAAAFGIDLEGTRYLLHRGKVGGGRKGIGKERFLETYSGLLVPVQDGDKVSELIAIGALDDTRILGEVAHFVRAVARFKEGAVEAKIEFAGSFSPEFSCEKVYSTRDQIVAQCNHGVVVNTLERILRKLGYRTGNDQYRDLVVLDTKGRIRVLIEVKGGSDTTSIYQAVGQLFMHATDDKERLVAVLPEPISLRYRDRFRALGILLVTYTWDNQEPEFKDIELRNDLRGRDLR